MITSDLNSIALELKKELGVAVLDAMLNEVSDVVKVAHADAIQRVVYNPYSPSYYKRRESLSGLIDKKNMQITRYSKLGISMKNITRANPRYGGDARFSIADSIEFGTGIMAQIGARPFFKETIRTLKSNGLYLFALKAGLERQGYNVLSMRKR